jgi:hypothetical protein
MRGTEHGQPLNFPSIEKFPGDQAGLDGLADAHVIGNEKPDRVEFEGHQERDDLIGPRLHGDAAKGAERACRGTGTQADRVTQKPAGTVVSYPGWVGQVKGGRLHLFQRKPDACHFIR